MYQGHVHCKVIYHLNARGHRVSESSVSFVFTLCFLRWARKVVVDFIWFSIEQWSTCEQIIKSNTETSACLKITSGTEPWTIKYFAFIQCFRMTSLTKTYTFPVTPHQLTKLNLKEHSVWFVEGALPLADCWKFTYGFIRARGRTTAPTVTKTSDSPVILTCTSGSTQGKSPTPVWRVGKGTATGAPVTGMSKHIWNISNLALLPGVWWSLGLLFKICKVLYSVIQGLQTLVLIYFDLIRFYTVFIKQWFFMANILGLR